MNKIISSIAGILVALSAAAAENLSWESKSLLAGKADVVSGGYVVARSLGTANFSPEFRMPVQLVYDSLGDKSGIFGDNWRSPQLESRVFPRDNGMEWTAPWGEKISFFENEKKNGRILYSPYSDWEASGSKGSWIVKNKDGWKFEYKDSYLREISSPSERSLAFEYDGKKLAKITQNSISFVELKYSKDELVSEISINGEKNEVGYVLKHATMLPETLGGKIQTAERTYVSEIRKGEFNPVQFKYNDDGFLCEIANGRNMEKLTIQKETIDQRIAFIKKFDDAQAKPGKPLVFQEVKLGRLEKDGDYEYSYPAASTVNMKNHDGQTASVSYNMMKGVLRTRDFAGRTSETYFFRRYDVAFNGKLRQIRDGKDRTVLNIRYDKDSGKPTIIRDMADNETFYAYDKSGNVTMISRSESDNPRRPYVAFKYDGRGNPVSVEMLDRNGKAVHATRLQYDQHSQVIAADTDESSAKFQYNTFGLVVKSTDTFGRSVSREYDKFNRLSSITDANGTFISYGYSGMKLDIIEKYSAADRKELLSSIRFNYDKETGMLSSYADDRGRTCKFDRDAEGRIAAQYYPDNSLVKYSFDASGRLEEVIDQNRNPIRFKYGVSGKIAERITAAGQVASCKYDGQGLLERVTKSGNGGIAQEITYSYDDLDRCTRISYVNGQEKNIKYNSRGKILRIEDATRSTEDLYSHIEKTIQSVDFAYDQFDRVISKTYTKATIPFKQFASEKKEEKTTHEYSYTNSGKRKSLVVTFADGSKKLTEWKYDSYGRIEKIIDNGQEVVYRYDAKARLAEKTLPGGLVEKYGYDTQGRLARKALCSSIDKAGLALAELKYAYSKDGSIESREVNGRLQKYEYDLRGQLVSVKDDKGGIIEKYAYDPAGNILSKTVGGKTTEFRYDAANQLVTATMPDGTRKTFEYDGAGRLVKEGNRSFSYGWLDKVLKVEDNETVSNFEYYADGQLAERRTGNIEEDFAWDGLALIRRDKVDYTVEPHPNGGNAILARSTGSGQTSGNAMFNDMLGSSLGTVENGSFSGIERTAFGSTAGSSSADFFTGKPNVEGLGYSFLFRNYRADVGKWQTADPLGYPDGWNNLAYVNNSVMECIDKFGTDIIHLVDPNGAVFNAGHSAWIIGNDQNGYTTYDYRPDGSESSSGSSSGSVTQSFTNFTDALNHLNSGRTSGNQYTQAQTLPTTSADDTVANWAASLYMNDPYSLTGHNCYQLGIDMINAINQTNNTNYVISSSMVPNTAFTQNLNNNWWQTAVPE